MSSHEKSRPGHRMQIGAEGRKGLEGAEFSHVGRVCKFTAYGEHPGDLPGWGGQCEAALAEQHRPKELQTWDTPAEVCRLQRQVQFIKRRVRVGFSCASSCFTVFGFCWKILVYCRVLVGLQVCPEHACCTCTQVGVPHRMHSTPGQRPAFAPIHHTDDAADALSPASSKGLPTDSCLLSAAVHAPVCKNVSIIWAQSSFFMALKCSLLRISHTQQQL